MTASVSTERPTLRNAPILWIALLLLGLCIVGTMAVVAISAEKGADELPAMYHSEGVAADTDLAALTRSAQRALRADVSVDGRRVAVTLQDRDGGIVTGAAVELQLTHATRDGMDRHVTLRPNSDGQLAGSLDSPLAAGAWWVELRPATADWILRGRIRPSGGRLGPGLL